ncbi:MAG TPA: hypothetical protein PLZ51_05480, partial [Aggregatilineales bacterium]|nr:hypothetical protein [Aggregatilineales bacterium]
VRIWDLADSNNQEAIWHIGTPNEMLTIADLHWNNGYLAVRQLYNDSVVILDDQTGEKLDTILVENGRFIWSDNTGYYATFRNEPIQLHKYCDEITPPEDILGISQAITAGNSGSFGNTICLAPNSTYTLTAPLPNVTGDITIIGNGATLTMTGGAQIFNVAETGGLTLKDVTVSGGVAVQGGAIFNAGTLVLENVTLENNSATDGGAIYNTGSLTMRGGAIQNNTATNFGGGIYNVGEI